MANNQKLAKSIILKLQTQLNEEDALSLCKFIFDNQLLQFLLLLLKNKNLPLLQFLWSVFKEIDDLRFLINECMIYLLLASLDDNVTFFEMFKWYEEFGCHTKNISSNTITALYLKGAVFPQIKPLIIKLINTLDNFDNVNNRTIFFIYDEVDIIKPYIKNEAENIKRFMVRCYWFDSINTLIKIQNTVKLPFFGVGWYLLSTPAFNHIMTKFNKKFYEHENFATIFANYICVSNRWEFLPTIIQNVSQGMWNKFSLYFYMGRLTETFVCVLFHQMNKHKIPLTKLKSNVLYFNHISKYVEFLKISKYYDTFSTEGLKDKIIKPVDSFVDGILDASLPAVTPLMVIFECNNIEAIHAIVFDCSLYLSNRYKSEIQYIDSLLSNNELGWTKKMIDTYTDFKLKMNEIINDGHLGQKLVTKYNAYLPLETSGYSAPCKLKIINSILNMYSSLKIKKFKEEYKFVYDTCIDIKESIIIELKIIMKDVFSKPSPTDKDFVSLIVNDDNYNYINNNYYSVLDLLKYNTDIQTKVEFMVEILQVPISSILPILKKELFIKEDFILI
jgi:hypothetical protein